MVQQHTASINFIDPALEINLHLIVKNEHSPLCGACGQGKSDEDVACTKTQEQGYDDNN